MFAWIKNLFASKSKEPEKPKNKFCPICRTYVEENFLFMCKECRVLAQSMTLDEWKQYRKEDMELRIAQYK